MNSSQVTYKHRPQQYYPKRFFAHIQQIIKSGISERIFMILVLHRKVCHFKKLLDSYNSKSRKHVTCYKHVQFTLKNNIIAKLPYKVYI